MEPPGLKKACVADEGTSDVSDSPSCEQPEHQHPDQRLQGQGVTLVEHTFVPHPSSSVPQEKTLTLGCCSSARIGRSLRHRGNLPDRGLTLYQRPTGRCPSHCIGGHKPQQPLGRAEPISEQSRAGLELESKRRSGGGCGLPAVFAFSLLSLEVQAGQRSLGKLRKEALFSLTH